MQVFLTFHDKHDRKPFIYVKRRIPQVMDQFHNVKTFQKDLQRVVLKKDYCSIKTC